MIVAAAALLDRDGRVLVQQRPAGRHHAGLWEFPGGKLEPDESAEAALVRELSEELGIVVDPADCGPLAFASQPGLLFLLFTVTRWTGNPRALDAAAIAWFALDALANLPMPPADRPLIAALRRSI